MLIFMYCTDGVLRTLNDMASDDVAMFVCVADFNHTDIILLFDSEVAALIDAQLLEDEIDDWLWLWDIEEWLATLN